MGTEAVWRGGVEDHAFFCQFLLQAGVHCCDVSALFHARFVDVFRNNLTQVGGQAFPGALVGEEPETVPHVVGQGAVFLNFIQFGRSDDRQGVFLAVHHLGLQRGIDLAEVYGGWRGVECLEHGGPERRDRHADLEALEIGRRLDRLGGGGHLAETVVPDLVHGDQVGLGDLSAYKGAQIAVQCFPHIRIV